MSVTTYGVKGYKYQYRLTVLIALLHNRSEDEKLFAEMVGSEDITFVNADDNILEIQTKMEKRDLDLSLITEWLLHFQEYDGTNSLLGRIIEKKSCCLFITTSRCTDETRIFLNNFTDTNIKNVIPPQAFLKEVRKAISQSSFKDTKLGERRKKSSETISKEITDSELACLINNTSVWEQVNEDKIDDQVLLTLNKKYSVPQSQVETLYLKLLKIVEDGKDSKNDILPAFMAAIAVVQVNKYTLHQFYIPRNHEKKSEELLERYHSILLTGVSQCGKTELAKKIANAYVDKGFNKIWSTSELLTIENFFNQNPSESKIAILEDPFGHIKPKEGATDLKKRINDICHALPSHHKLIITSRTEILDEAFSSFALTDFTTLNITEDDTEEIMHFWDEFAEKYDVSGKIKADIREYIASEDKNKLQIGQLEYLAKYNKESLADKSPTELVTIARHNSVDIAADLSGENRERAYILGLLSICCSNITTVNKVDLKYIFSKDKIKYTVFAQHREFALLKGKNTYPKYVTSHKLSKKIKSYMAYFESRGFIRSNENTIIFSHPNYFEAARLLFFRKSYDEQKDTLKYIKKALACISPVTANFSCKELYPIYKKIDFSLKGKMRELMLLANKSIYPSVEDYASINLANVLEDFKDGEEKDKVVRIIDRGNTDSGSIKWYNGEIPFIGKETTFASGLRDIPNAEEAKLIEASILDGKYVKVLHAWNYVNYYQWQSQRRNNFKIQTCIINSLLTYDEVFIRKQVAKIFFSAKIESDEIFLIDKILGDSHPTVVFYGIWGAFLFWNKQEIEIKEYIVAIVKKLFERQEIAIRANDLISTFSIDYSGECIDWQSFSKDEKIELWNVWGEIFPIFSRSLPASIFVNVGRFGATMTTATKYLDLESGIKVFEAWYKRIEYKIQNNAELSDYEMGIIEDLISFTNDNNAIRKELFVKVFSHKNSTFLLYNLKNVLRYFESLHVDEKVIIMQLTNSDRCDVKWIHALLLAIYQIPEPLLSIVTNGRNIGILTPKEIIETLPSELIHNCLKIIYGNPHELGLLRPYEITEFWKKLINYILFYQVEPYFKLCIEEFIGPNIWGSRTENFLLWRKICLKNTDIDYLLYVVLYNISSSTIYIKGTCDIVANIKLAYERRGKLDDFTRIVAENIEIIQLRHREDIFEYFESDYIFKELIPAIYPDNFAKLALETIGFIGLVPIVDNIDTFRFFHTYDVIERLLNKDKSLDLEIRSKILALPNKINEVGERKQRDIVEKYLLRTAIPIDNWYTNS